MKFGGGKPTSLRLQVYRQLRQALRQGGLGRNQVATERDLAAELGVSRTPVREALALLVHDGLVVPTVKGFTLPEVTEQDVANIYEVRRLVECHALMLIVDRLSGADFISLREHLRAQEYADRANDTTAFVEANTSFHAIWINAVPNRQLREIIDRFDEHVRWIRELTLYQSETRRTAMIGLARILRALEEGDALAASRAMMDHLLAAERSLLEALKNFPGLSPVEPQSDLD
ncbi:MAG: GntR family transcriptional regulator [Sphingomonadales bacterium]|nr:MAG: GntR family transcriptional regulator [Sphingomonadales bacterium]TNF02254.1 MAG: GntR family transcriptional regulator [Sphingomonadales bacterium]